MGYAVVGGVDNYSNGGLGDPSKRFREETFQPVEVGPDKAEWVADGASCVKGM